MSDRAQSLEDFIDRSGWSEALRSPIKGDASTRSYTRLILNGQKAILMDAPRGQEPVCEPEGATVEERARLGYNALARLAGPELDAFVCVAQELTMRGFSAPEVFAADSKQGFAILEDLGKNDYFSVIHAKSDLEATLYEAAIDVLAAIYRSSFSSRSTHAGHNWTIREYDDAALIAEVGLLLDWYAPDVGATVNESARSEHNALWREAFECLQAYASGLALRDFHAQNLFWLPERTGQARVGLIDFQDALFAHPAYDLVSLLEDARRDVDPGLHEPMKQRFFDKAGLTNLEAFNAGYAVLAAQRNAKILGIFVRLATRDEKETYRALIPRVKAHFQRDLSHPACEALRRWYSTYIPELLV